MLEIDLSSTELFQNIPPEDLDALLTCLDVREKRYQKGEILFLGGAPTSNLGIILSGRIMIEMGDAWGGRSILGTIGPGGTFAEAYACMDDEPLLISVEVAEDTEVLMMDMHKILTICPSNCSHHHKLVENLLTILARKNLGLSRRMVYTASKSIRGRVLSYLSFLADKQGKKQVSIPFDRQEMADYLGVDRSALSAELSRMQKDGLIAYKKNHFTLFTDEL